MIYISHRGNLNKINQKDENKPSYILNALDQKYNVEVDIWFSNGKFYLGHDNPVYEVDLEFIKKNGLWFHAKNIEAFHELLQLNIVCFWHQNDDVTLTSNGYIWTYPGKQLTINSICVLPELHKIQKFNCAGICSDFIQHYFENSK
tara:strand:- start:965 stop:1402 length:438 start_codon:yes stop_codon:yes gene_type:complete